MIMSPLLSLKVSECYAWIAQLIDQFGGNKEYESRPYCFRIKTIFAYM